jgi:hypothetical protein
MLFAQLYGYRRLGRHFATPNRANCRIYGLKLIGRCLINSLTAELDLKGGGLSKFFLIFFGPLRGAIDNFPDYSVHGT